MSSDVSSPYIFIDDISNGKEIVPISFINERSFQCLSKSVSYISHNILISESLVEDFESVPLPCKCEDSCDAACSCGLGSSIAYKNGILSEEYLSIISKPIVECSSLCACKNCPNRVVQNGIRVHLQVFMTEHKGFGVRTLAYIPKHTFICEYAGELIDKDEAQKRLKKQRKEDSNYIYTLNEYCSENKKNCIAIDPTCKGNIGRYLNHSCTPNLVPVPVRANSMLPSICFFAKNDIMPYEELTYTYAPNIQEISMNLSLHESNEMVNLKNIETDKITCYCNSRQCTGFLPFVSNLL